MSFITLHDAIYALNASVVTIRGDIAYDKDENIVEYDMTAAQAKLIELQEAEDATQQAAETHKANAVAKLKAIGLTDDEIAALGVA